MPLPPDIPGTPACGLDGSVPMLGLPAPACGLAPAPCGLAGSVPGGTASGAVSFEADHSLAGGKPADDSRLQAVTALTAVTAVTSREATRSARDMGVY